MDINIYLYREDRYISVDKMTRRAPQNFMLPKETLRAPFSKPREFLQEKRTGLNSFVLRFRSPSSSSRQ